MIDETLPLEDGDPEPKGRQRAAYDIETSDWTKPGWGPICFGAVWGPPGRRKEFYLTKKQVKASGLSLMGAALQAMYALTQSENIGHWWAHNGGKFDALALCEAAHDMGWKVDFTNSVDGRILQANFTPPDHRKGKRPVSIRDSFAMVPGALKHKRLDCAGNCAGCCSCDFGLGGAVFDSEDYSGDMERLPPERLRAGCLRDCELVLLLLERIETLAHPVKLGLTFSQTALGILKSMLSEECVALPVHGGRYARKGDNQVWNKQAEEAYYGGRVEVLHHALEVPMCELDRTSSYPAAMLNDMPWEFVGASKKTRQIRKVLNGEDNLEGVVHCKVSVPHKQLYPVLPIRAGADQSMYFPTGTFTGWWPANELRYAQTQGTKILELYEAVAYTRARPFERIVRKLFELKRTSTGAARQFWKLTLNALYGKFGQQPVRESMRMFSNSNDAGVFMHRLPTFQKPRPVGKSPPKGGRTIAWERESWPKHTHFAIASYITAYARIALHQAMVLCGDDLAYVDTDAVHFRRTARPRLASLEGNALGEWKVELDNFEGDYFAPKIYMLWHPDCPQGVRTGTNCEKHVKGFLRYAAKGFPVGPVEFRALITGDVVRRETMRLIRSQLADNGKMERVSQTKTWQGVSRKRKPFPDGSTRPWTYEELRRRESEKAQSPHARQIPTFP